ncbi:MAG: transketolase, partial [Gammaproteobacteria bacterium]|nr:transketolase [Gammaproteobacteria bacterium]
MPTRRDLANAIRALSMDAVQKANSGHPGMPMGMADIAEVLWNDFLVHNPQNPHWFNRDRFILSNGHGSMLQYALLYLTGYDVSIEDLKSFRQLHSKTPGHPEWGLTPGVETTTGPLGQGLANGVGMALAEKILASRYNVGEYDIINHFTYVFCGDGCLMEGISHEACSLAGTLGLGKLIVFYDDNGISIDGEVQGWFTDDTPKRFEGYGWQVIPNVDGHHAESLLEAIKQARRDLKRPTLICCKTQIGFGAPNKANTAGAHGSPLGESEIQLTREKLGWFHLPFEVPVEILSAWDARDRGRILESAWQSKWAAYQNAYPKLATQLEQQMRGKQPEHWAQLVNEALQKWSQEAVTVATRKSSEMVLDLIAPHLPQLIGGSADLTGSNNTWWKGSKAISSEDASGNYVFYGVREFGMAAVMTGLSLHGGFLPYGGTFLVFSDYARNAIRLAALMRQRVVYVLTHDSIGLGEDGPTHQPIEHLASLRMIPGLEVWRPCDTVETLVAWQQAVEYQGPSVLALSRQNLPAEARAADMLSQIHQGGYVLRSHPAAALTLLSTGSEVAL